MVKSRFNSIDVAASVNALRLELSGMRLSNIYDIDNRTYLLKFSKPEGKAFLIIESGVRIHLSTFSHEKADIPSGFTMKIRRHCRTKRLDSVRQLGMDRIVHFTFGTGEAAHHLIVELFAKGNIILTDWTGKILTLLRTHRYSEDYEVRTGALYRFADAQPVPEVTMELLRDVLEKAKASEQKETLSNTLNSKFNMGTQLVDHCVRSCDGLLPKRNIRANPLTEEQIKSLFGSLVQGSEMLMKLKKGEEPAKGFIIMKDAAPEEPGAGSKKSSTNNDNNVAADDDKGKDEAEGDEETEEDRARRAAEAEARRLHEERLKKIARYEDFGPVMLKQFEGRSCEEYESFHKAVDEFYTGMEQGKQLKQVGVKDRHVDKKVDKAKRDQILRIRKLEEQQLSNQEKAQLIELNLADVDEAIAIIRSGLESGTDWSYLDHVVKVEKRNGNPIAGMIHSLDLPNDSISLLLSNPLHTEDEEATAEAKLVEIDLNLTAYANVRKYYETMKKAKDKKEKTLAVTEGVVGRAAKKAEKGASEMKAKVTIMALRKVHWWEKFNWFISSDGLVVIAGRDAQQNELLVKRYMRKGDVYVHAEVHGAASCIIKSKTAQEVEIPVDTLTQAGMMTMCRSSAWTAKVPVNAWWVYPEQVSKTAPSGEYLSTGSFMIRGKKNGLPMATLTMGIAVLFRVTQDSALKNHSNDRLRVSQSDSEFEDGGEASDEENKFGDDSDDDEDDDDEDEEGVVPLVDSRYQLQISTESTGLDDEEGDDDDEEDGKAKGKPKIDSLTASGNAMKEKKGLSIAEKKRLKKQKQMGIVDADASEPLPKQEPAAPKEKKGPKQPEKVRGKHGKLKKIEKKYKDQTPEERAEMERLMHGSSKKAMEEQAKADAEANVEIAAGLQEILENDEGAGQRHHAARAGRKAAEKQEVQAILEEEKIMIADKMMSDGDENELSTLVGNPHPEDEILYALYVCAPWSSLQGYKYKIKVVPGPAGKKSRVANQAMSTFVKQAEASTPREAELVKSIPVEELLHLLPPSSRLLLGLMGGPKKGQGGKKKKGGNKRRGGNKRNAKSKK